LFLESIHRILAMKLSYALAIIAVVTPTLASTPKLFCGTDSGAVNKCKGATNAPEWLKDVGLCEAYVNDSGFNQTLRNCFHNTLSATTLSCADIIPPNGKCFGGTGYCDRLEGACGFSSTGKRFANKAACVSAVDHPGSTGVLKVCLDTHLQYAVDDAAKNASVHCDHASMKAFCVLGEAKDARTFGLAIKRDSTSVKWATADQYRAALASELKWATAASDFGSVNEYAKERYLEEGKLTYKDNQTAAEGNLTVVLPLTVLQTMNFDAYFNLKKLADLNQLTAGGSTFSVRAFRTCGTVDDNGNLCGAFQCACPATVTDTAPCVKQNAVAEGLDRKKCFTDNLNRGLFQQSIFNSLKNQDTLCGQIDNLQKQCSENYLIANLYEAKKCTYGANSTYASAEAFRQDLDKAGRNLKQCLTGVLVKEKLPNGLPPPNATKCQDAAGKGSCNVQTTYTFSAKCGNTTCTQTQINDKIKAILGSSNSLSNMFDVNDFGGANGASLVTADGSNFKITVTGPIPNGTNIGALLTANLPTDTKVEGFNQVISPGTPNPPVKGSVALVATISAVLLAMLVAVLML
jgi:hypothetical protein